MQGFHECSGRRDPAASHGNAVEGAHEAVEAEVEHLCTWRSQEPIKEEIPWSSGGPGVKAGWDWVGFHVPSNPNYSMIL